MKLVRKKVKHFVTVWEDEQLQILRPTNIPEGYFSFGDVIIPSVNYQKKHYQTYCYSQRGNSNQLAHLLSFPLKFEPIWSSHHKREEENDNIIVDLCSIWKPIPPPHYYVCYFFCLI